MSETVLEIAEREAAEAEAEDETGEDEDDTTAEPEPEPEPDDDDEPEAGGAPEPPSDKAAEKALGQIERAGDTYSRKVASIQERTPLGLVECPLCPVPGFVPDELVEPPAPEQVAVVLAYLGVERPPEYLPSPNYHACPSCDGLGFVATGSQRQGYTDVDCDACMGKGYVDARHERELAALHSPEGQVVTPPSYPQPVSGSNGSPAATVTQGGHSFALAPGASPDQHGRLAGHPLWGFPAESGGF